MKKLLVLLFVSIISLPVFAFADGAMTFSLPTDNITAAGVAVVALVAAYVVIKLAIRMIKGA
jgi:hypothetical protein